MKRPWELQLVLDQASGKAVYLQIADTIIAAIKNGQLLGGTALPGSRQLALKLGVNRNTIIEALDLLNAEGWTVSKERSGTFIAHDLPLSKPKNEITGYKPEKTLRAIKPTIIFDDGFPDSRIAPIKELSRAYRQLFERNGRWHILGYTNESGSDAFKNAIVQMLNVKRGMRLSGDEVFITRGSQMAMYLAAQCLLTKGDIVAIEHPGYKPAWQAFQLAGADLLPIDVDNDGMITDQLSNLLKKGKRIKAVYTTPHHQFPTTVTMSLQRRLELIALSNKYNFTIIEDDYDNEFHFGHRPVLPISSYEHAVNYIYIGSMSKVVAPALRIGYLASTKTFVAKVGELRKLIDVQGDAIMEQAVLQLINEGEIKRHLKRATTFYKNKRDYLEQIIADKLGDKVIMKKPEGGLAMWIAPRKPGAFIDLEKKLLRKGVQIVSPGKFTLNEQIVGIRLGYGSLSEQDLMEGISALAKCI